LLIPRAAACPAIFTNNSRSRSISVAVRDDVGKLVMECVIETKAATVLELIAGLRGDLPVAFEEGTSAAWLYDLLKPHVSQVMVCDPRKNALLKAGNKSDRVAARKFSELLRAGRTHVTGTEPKLSHRDQRSHASDESAQSPLSKLGDPLRGAKSIRRVTAPVG
jgi:hypothetical protein